MKRYLGLLALAMVANVLACNDHDLEQPGTAVQVINAAVSTAKAEGPLLVTVIGELKNTTDEKVDNLVLEARLTDANGKVVDVLSESVYGLVVPPGDQVSFRLQGAAAATAASYVNAQVRVVSAESHPRVPETPPKAGWGSIGEIAVAWAPMLLLILVWIVLARRFNGKGSNQHKMLLAVNEQNALLTRQSAAIESIAASLSAGNKKLDMG